MFQDISSRQETQIFSKKSDKHIQEMLRWRSFQDLPDEEMSHHERKRSLEERKRQVEEEARRSSLEEQRRLHLRKEEEKRISLEAEVRIKAKITSTSMNASKKFLIYLLRHILNGHATEYYRNLIFEQLDILTT